MTFGPWESYTKYDNKVSPKCLWVTADSQHENSKIFAGRSKVIQNDTYVIVTYSLGSQMALDGLTYLSEKLDQAISNPEEVEALRLEMGKKNVTIFMLANQLPLLRLGRTIGEDTGFGKICSDSEGDKQKERWLKLLSIVAFSDPNDLLSYPIPPDFPERYIESRFCPRLTNVILNIAGEIDFLTYLNLADPFTAHTGYDTDERVIDLIINGTKINDTKDAINVSEQEKGGANGDVAKGKDPNAGSKCSMDIQYQ